MNRRSFIRNAAQTTLASAILQCVPPELAASSADLPLIIDTHQHLWDLSSQKLPWLAGAPDVLNRSYTTEEINPIFLAFG